MRVNESDFLSSDGKSLVYTREYIPDTEIRGIVQIAHGIAEHITRYDDFARFLADHGYIVVGNDHLGHGKTAAPDELGLTSDFGWDKMIADIRTLHDMTAAKFPGLPYFLLGHSMGSFLARTYIIRFNTGLDGVILTGTGQQRKPVILLGKQLGMRECKKNGADYFSEKLDKLAFGKYNDQFDIRRTVFDWLSRDDDIVDAYVDDPLCGFIPSVGLFLEMMRGIEYITKQRNLSRMKKNLPIYFLSGDSDPVGDRGEGVIRAYRSFLKAGMRDVSMKLYHDARHEILNEINREEVFEDIRDWLDGKTGK
ncbi:MAG: alpha/beta hydrolase [Eubacteriales bacterium]|nr:alpha/beta hydrolase [Eubacteriales bacterium]